MMNIHMHNYKDFYSSISDFDLRTHLHWDINVGADCATMVYFLEAHSPFPTKPSN